MIQKALITGNYQLSGSKKWFILFLLCLLMAVLGGFYAIKTMGLGLGNWGNTQKHVWGIAIVNFVWWIGVGHAGTFISAILLISKKNWRKPIARIAETMTLGALSCAAILPVLHMGRPYLFYWMFPIWNDMGPLWINFSSPLVWDVFAIGTYVIISLLFWYSSLIPDFAILSNKTKNMRTKRIFSKLSIRFSFTTFQKHLYATYMLVLAAIVTPVVISVHSIVSLDFAATINQSWHNSIFPPYFVFGALFSGFAFVQLLVIFFKKIFQISILNTKHIANINTVILLTSLLMSGMYFTEWYIAFADKDTTHLQLLINKYTSSDKYLYISMFFCNSLIPLLLAFRCIRQNIFASFVIALLVIIGMWIERYVIIIGAMNYSELYQNTWSFIPTVADAAVTIGLVGWFGMFILLVFRFIPVINLYEN